jgi:prepilin-type N-terminal cleavage/methylation domain-containing protein
MRTICVSITAQDQWPSDEEIRLRNIVIAELEAAGIGWCVESGAGCRVMELVLETNGNEEDLDHARVAIGALFEVRFPGRSARVHLEELTSVSETREDRDFYDLLGVERKGTRCRHVGCTRGTVAMSAFCRRHHYEQVQGHACPFADRSDVVNPAAAQRRYTSAPEPRTRAGPDSRSGCRYCPLPRRARNPGFSLMELIVVMVILMVLLAFLLPTISALRRRMMTTTCMNNLRQLGQAIHAYRADYQKWPSATYIPKPFEVLNPNGFPPIYQLLSGYLALKSKVYRCPADQRVWLGTAQASANGFGISYEYVIWDKIETLSREDKASFPIMGDLSGASMTWQVDPPHPGLVANRLHKDGSVDSYKVGDG